MKNLESSIKDTANNSDTLNFVKLMTFNYLLRNGEASVEDKNAVFNSIRTIDGRIEIDKDKKWAEKARNYLNSIKAAMWIAAPQELLIAELTIAKVQSMLDNSTKKSAEQAEKELAGVFSAYRSILQG